VGVASLLSVSALGGDKMARTASHPSSRGVHDGSMCPPLIVLTQEQSLVAESRTSEPEAVRCWT
jgi:hypothetical protein